MLAISGLYFVKCNIRKLVVGALYLNNLFVYYIIIQKKRNYAECDFY